MKVAKMSKSYRILTWAMLGITLLMLVVVCCYAFKLVQMTESEQTVYLMLLCVTVLALYLCPQMLLRGVAVGDEYLRLRSSGLLPTQQFVRLEDIMFCTEEESARSWPRAYTLMLFLKDGQQLTAKRMFFDARDWAELQKQLPNFYPLRRARSIHPTYRSEPVYVRTTRYYLMLVYGAALAAAAYFLYQLAL